MTTVRKISKKYFIYQWGSLGIALLTLGGFIGYTQFHDHRRIGAREASRLKMQAEIVGKNLEPQLLLANRVITGVLGDLPSWQAAPDGYQRANRKLQVINDTLIGIRPILVIRADGKVVASSDEKLVGMNFAKRAYFRTAVKNPDPNILHVSAPFRTVLNTYVFSLFRVIPGQRGEFNGIVIVSVVPEFFSTLLDSVRYAPDMRAAIIHGDDRLFLMSQEKQGVMENGLTTQGASHPQGENRLTATRTVRLAAPHMDNPLRVVVDRDLDALFAPWRKSLLIQSMLFGLLSAFASLGLYFIQRHRREQFAELKVAEESLMESEKHHRTILQAAIDGIWLVDMQGRLLEANESYCRASGYSLPELQSMHIADLEVGGTAEQTQRQIRKLVALGEDRVETRHRRKDYSTFDVEISFQYLPSKRMGLVAFIRDITHRKMAEQSMLALKDELQRQYEELRLKEQSLCEQNDELLATEEMLRVQVNDYRDGQRLLKESEERFRALHDATFSGIIIHKNGIIVDCNQALSEITGFSSDELIGMDGLKLIAEKWHDRMALNIQSGSERPYEVEGLRKNGGRYPLSLRGKSIRYKDHSARVIEFRDVSELKRVEESLRESKRQYENLASRISVGIYILHSTQDGAFALDYVSPVMAKMLDMSVESLLTDDRLLFRAIHPDDLDSFVDLNREGIQTLRPFNWEGRFIIEGAVKWLNFASAPEPLEKGYVLWHGVVSDVTERKKHEDDLLKMEKLESLGLLAGGIAHDFNNILTAIMGNISFAKVFIDSAHKSYKPMFEAEIASVRASELAHQLLTFARGGTPVKKPLSVQLLINESVSLVLHGSNVNAHVAIPASIQAIEADEGQMSQIFHNLIINATQAMPGGGTLEISAENETLGIDNRLSLAPGTYVRCMFADQGCGISDQNLLKIFDPYFTTKSKGSGLGLSSVSSIVKRHGGHIGVNSIAGKGTVFTIHLPSKGRVFPKQPSEPTTCTPATCAGGSILVMDDEEMIRDMATGMLLYLGYQVTTCENGTEAVATYNAARESGKPFFAVIMDLTIPGGMGGKVAAEQILLTDPEATLIVSSGYSNDPIMSDFGEYGFTAAVAKPYLVKELADLLETVCQAKSAARLQAWPSNRNGNAKGPEIW